MTDEFTMSSHEHSFGEAIVYARTGRHAQAFAIGESVPAYLVHPAEYRIWSGMRGRCNNPRARGWADWGGRGIRVCPEWDCPGGFGAFFAHVGSRPSTAHSIDRFPDNNGNYAPGNVRWATWSQQNSNKRKRRLLGRDITDRQREILVWICRFVDAVGLAPTLREIGAATGISSTNGVHEVLDVLERKGYVQRVDARRARGIKI